jgi:hypothetical protein
MTANEAAIRKAYLDERPMLRRVSADQRQDEILQLLPLRHGGPDAAGSVTKT